MRIQKYATQIEAVKKSNTGKKLTKTHKRAIAKARKDKDYVVIMIQKRSKVKFFNSAADAAKKIGCTRQLISQCIKHPDVYKSARGWKIVGLDFNQYIDIKLHEAE